MAFVSQANTSEDVSQASASGEVSQVEMSQEDWTAHNHSKPKGDPADSDSEAAFLSLTFLLSLLFLCVAWGIKPSRREDVLAELGQIEDVEATGLLMRWLDIGDPEVRAVIVEVVCRLLPRIGPEEAALISDQDWNQLYRALDITRADKDFALITVTLQTIERLSDSRALPYVRGLVEVSPDNNFQERISAAACWCLPGLEEQVRQERVRQTLLRPATSSDADAKLLMRPAVSNADEEPGLLLRASSRNSANEAQTQQ